MLLKQENMSALTPSSSPGVGKRLTQGDASDISANLIGEFFNKYRLELSIECQTRIAQGEEGRLWLLTVMDASRYRTASEADTIDHLKDAVHREFWQVIAVTVGADPIAQNMFHFGSVPGSSFAQKAVFNYTVPSNGLVVQTPLKQPVSDLTRIDVAGTVGATLGE